MKIAFPKNNVTKTVEIPNWLLLNRVAFGILKLFLLTKSSLFFKIKYKQLKPVVKAAKKYKGCEIVTVHSHNGDEVKVFL